MKFSFRVAVGSLAALMVTAASAVTVTNSYDLLTLSGTNSYPEPARSFSASTDFTDNYSFMVGDKARLSIVVDSLSTTSTRSVFGHLLTSSTGLSDFVVWFDGSLLALSTASSTQGASPGPTVTQTLTTFKLDPMLVLAGSSHTLSIQGSTPATGGGSYSGLVISLVDAPTAVVPEPEIYALMLAGLCAVGFLARRRRGD